MPFHHPALDFDLGDCQVYLASLANRSLDERGFPDSIGTDLEPLDYEDTKRFLTDHAKQVEVLPKICCAALQLMDSSTSSSAAISACRVLLVVCSLSAASATGCKTFSILDTCLSFIGKQVYPLVKASDDAPGYKPNTQPETLSSGDGDDIDIPASMDEDSGHLELDTTEPRRRGRSRRSRSDGTANATDLRLLLSTLCETASLWRDVTDDHLLTSLADLLWCTVYLCTLSPESARLSSTVDEALGQLATQSAHGLLAMHRAAVPLLAGHVSSTGSLPTKPRACKAFHTAVGRAYVHLLPRFAGCTTLSLPPAARGGERPWATPPAPRRQSALRTPSTARSTASALDDKEGEGKDEALPFALPALAVLGLVQRVVLTSPADKAAVRSRVAEVVGQIVQALLPLPGCVQHLVDFLARLMTAAQVSHRALAVDVLAHILPRDTVWTTHDLHVDAVFDALLERCQDHHPAVRLRALSLVAALLAAHSPASPPRLRTLLCNYTTGRTRVRGGQALMDMLKALLQVDARGAAQAKAKALALYALALSRDLYPAEEAVVRLSPTAEDLAVFGVFCQPVHAVSVRKAAVQGLADLLAHRPTSEEVRAAFLSTLLPLVHDSEAGVVAKAVAVFDAVCVQPLRAGPRLTPRGLAAWRLLRHAGALGLTPLLRSLLREMFATARLDADAVRDVLAGTQALCTGAVSTSEEVCTPEEEVAALRQDGWALLDLLVSLSHVKLPGSGTDSCLTLGGLFAREGLAAWVLAAFRRGPPAAAGGGGGGPLTAQDVCILKVLQRMPALLSRAEAAGLLREVDQPFSSLLSLRREVVAVLVSARCALCPVVEGEDWAPRMARWSHEMLGRVHTVLSAFCFGQGPPSTPAPLSPIPRAEHNLLAAWGDARSAPSALAEDRSEEVQQLVLQYLLLLGEIAMLGFRADEVDVAKYRTRHTFSLDSSRANSTNAGETAGGHFAYDGETKYFKVLVPPALMDLVKVLMAEELPAQHVCPEKLRAAAFIVFGKMCLRDFQLARENINIFVREIDNRAGAGPGPGLGMGMGGCILNSSTNSVDVSALASSEDCGGGGGVVGYSVRNNALFVLGDLCIKYTHLVDAHIDTLASCLQDRAPAVRRHALLLLAQLLSQEFVKLKGALFYRLLLLLNDLDGEIQAFASDLLQRTLRKKYPAVFQHCLVDVIVLLNGCTSHPLVGENVSLGLAAPLPREARFAVYDFLVHGCDSDEARLQLTARLVQDVIAVAVDHKELLQDRSGGIGGSASKRRGGPLSPFEAVVEDALRLLQSPALRPAASSSSSLRGGGGGAEGPLDEAGGEEDDDAATGAALPLAAAAKQRVLSALTSQHVVAHTLPVVLSLKHLLEATKSPLQGDLMDLLLHLSQTHRREVAAALAGDPTLQAELDYDLRLHDRQRRAALRRAEASPRPVLDRFLDPKHLPLSSVKKPALRTDRPPSTARLSATRLSLGTTVGASFVHSAEEDEDPMLRLAEDYSPPVPAPESHRRRSWGVVVSSLVSAKENDNTDQQPPKKRRVSGADTAKGVLADSLLSPAHLPQTARATPSPAVKDAPAETAALAVPAQRELSRGKRVGGGSSLLFR